MKLLTFLLLSTLPFAAYAQAEGTQAEATPANLDPCFTNSAVATCRDFIYPEELAVADMTNLCKEMDFMSGCSIKKSCPSPTLDPYCHPVSLLADVCVMDHKMSHMTGCNNYNSLCKKEGSVVEQCKKEVGIPHIVSTSRALDRIWDICAEMDMDGCSNCPRTQSKGNGTVNWPSCDILKTYSQLCMAMPDMKQCPEWKAMCEDIPDSEYCDVMASPFNSPSMRMYFHGGIMDYILFEFWVPRTRLAYALSCIAVFFLGLALEGIKIAGLHLEHHWIMADALRQTEKQPYTMNILLKQDIPRVFVTFFSQTLSYAVMLITMTFNWGIFFFTVLGIAVGAGALRRFQPMPKSKMDEITCVEDCC